MTDDTPAMFDNRRPLWLPPPKGRICERCGKDKDHKEFRRTGHGGRTKNCEDCLRERRKNLKSQRDGQGWLFNPEKGHES